MERAVFGSILEQRVEVHKAGWNIATFQCRDVLFSSLQMFYRLKICVLTFSMF